MLPVKIPGFKMLTWLFKMKGYLYNLETFRLIFFVEEGTFPDDFVKVNIIGKMPSFKKRFFNMASLRKHLK